MDKKEQIKSAIEDVLYAAGYGTGFSSQTCKNDIVKGSVLTAAGAVTGAASLLTAKAVGDTVSRPVKTALTVIGCAGGLVLGMGIGDIVGGASSLKKIRKVEDKLNASLKMIDDIIDGVIDEKPVTPTETQ